MQIRINQELVFISIDSSTPPTVYKCGLLCSVFLRNHVGDLSVTGGKWG